MRSNSIAWLNRNHPNFSRWERARNLSLERGKFVIKIVSTVIKPKNLTILDLGSGEGGTSKIFSDGNRVISFDLSKIRLIRQRQNYQLKQQICGDAVKLPFKDAMFDLVILQDVIEHVDDHQALSSEVRRILKSNGIIYLSTPNKFSLLNLISDPHWGFPVIALMNRRVNKKFFLSIFRKDELNRKDIPELLSLNKVKLLFGNEFEIYLFTKLSVIELFNGNEGIVWSNFHIRLINFLKKIRADSLIEKIANDNFGIINKIFTPTFYFIMKKNI